MFSFQTIQSTYWCWSYYCYLPEEKTITLVSWKIHLFYYKIVKIVSEEKGSQELQRFTPGWDMIYSVSSFSMRQAQGWLNTFNPLHFFFILESYSLSTLANLVHLDFSLSLNPRLPDLPESMHMAAGHLVSPLLCSLSPAVTHAFFLPASTYAIPVAFLLSFVYLKTQLHPIFEIHELTWLIKGHYVTLWYFIHWHVVHCVWFESRTDESAT